MSGLQTLLQVMIEHWRTENIPIPPGVDDAKIVEFESHYGVRLPSDMREYFATVNGMGDHFDEESFFRFWPLDEMQLVEERRPEVTAAFPESNGYFFFFDHSIEVFLYAIRLNNSEHAPTPIAMVYPGSDIVGTPSFEVALDSFTQFLELYVADPGKLFSPI